MLRKNVSYDIDSVDFSSGKEQVEIDWWNEFFPADEARPLHGESLPVQVTSLHVIALHATWTLKWSLLYFDN